MSNDPSSPGQAVTGDHVDPDRSDDDTTRMAPDADLDRIGVDPRTVDRPYLETLARIQRAHVTTIPFENLAIVGDPHGDREGEGVILSTPHLHEKIVEQDRGGYCFGLNGLFHWLLDELGYDVDRVAARIVGSDGDARPPANHHSNVVELDRRYVVDVGMGTPVMRRPTPLDGSTRKDEVGVEWRVAESDRPDETYCTEYRSPDEEGWSTRYVFSDKPCDLDYFAATNDYLQSAPESPFTGGPVVSIATDDGHRKLSADTLTEVVGAEETERHVAPEEWHATLAESFALDVEQG